MALRYHPDKVPVRPNGGVDRDQLIQTSTLKFQAASAAYEVLSDARRRAVYDATGGVGVGGEHDTHDGPSSYPSGAGSSKAEQKRWEEFFQSVFNEVLSSGTLHGDADSYRGSTKEAADVLKYYVMCKGDMDKVAKCGAGLVVLALPSASREPSMRRCYLIWRRNMQAKRSEGSNIVCG